ncbi:MAG: hypothetical protein U1C73_19995, partial [Dietzia sp.]|nr:hypothetical protein [Dietzia sp.]
GTERERRCESAVVNAVTELPVRPNLERRERTDEGSTEEPEGRRCSAGRHRFILPDMVTWSRRRDVNP